MVLSENELLPQIFYKHVEQRKDETYLVQPLDGGKIENFTFGRVLDDARRLAAHLRSLDLPPQSKIAIISKNCAHFFITDLAIWMAGHVSVALYPTLTADIVSYILEHSEAKLVVVGKLDIWDQLKEGVPADLPGIAMPLAPKTDYTAWQSILDSNEPIEDLPKSGPDDEALIVYTSGSTGRPKGVVHSFQTISAPTKGLVKSLGITRDDRLLSYLPLAHTMDRWLSEMVSLYTGATIYFAESLTTFVKDLARARPTLFVSVPRLWLKFQLGVFAKMPPNKLNLFLKIPILSGIVKKKIVGGLGLDAVRFAGSGSAPIPAELIQWYRSLGLELLEGYGMSENFNFSHMTDPGHGRAGYIGTVHPGVECKISEAGEILVKSPGTMIGYYKQPDITAECMTDDGFLKTGDRGEIDSEGRLKITGRIKELFKTSKGKYVAPVPIENLINADNRIEACCVAGSAQPATHAVLQLSEDLRAAFSKGAADKGALTKDLEGLLKDINSKLPNYEQMQFLVVPKDVWSVEGGQLTPTLKLKRTAIEDMYAPKLDDWYGRKEAVIWE